MKCSVKSCLVKNTTKHSSKQQREVSSVSRKYRHEKQRCHNRSSCLQKSIPEQSLSSLKEGWVPKTSNKSEISKRSCEIPTLQDGGPFRDKEPAPKRGLSTQDRPKGGLFSYVHQSETQKVSSVSMVQQNLPTYSPTFRSGGSPTHIHKDPKTSFGSPKKASGDINNLLGRHPYNGRKSRKAEVTQGFHPIPFTETGLCNKLEKKNLKSNSRDRIFRVSDKLRRHDVLSPKNKDR